MARKEYKKYFSLLFSSLAVVVIGAVSLFENGRIDYYSVMGALTKIVPAVVVLGGLGWILGSIVDMPRRGHRVRFNNNVMEQLMQEAAAATSNSVQDADSEIDISAEESLEGATTNDEVK